MLISSKLEQWLLKQSLKTLKKFKRVRYYVSKCNAAKPLNSGHLRLLKDLSVIERCPLLRGNLKKISHLRLNTLSTIQGMSAIWDVRYWEVSVYISVFLDIAKFADFRWKSADVSVLSFIIVGFVRQVLRIGPFCSPAFREQHRKGPSE